MRLYVIVTLKSGARLLGEVQAEGIEAAVRTLEQSLSEPRLPLSSGPDQLVIQVEEIAAFQVSLHKP